MSRVLVFWPWKSDSRAASPRIPLVPGAQAAPGVLLGCSPLLACSRLLLGCYWAGSGAQCELNPLVLGAQGRHQ